MSLPLIDRLWARTEVDEDGCWMFQHCHFPSYGNIKYAGSMFKVHRVSWILHRSPIPLGLWVLHHCDNPSCWNPEHLFLGTQQDNVDDMIDKGRKADVSGFNNPNSRLSELDIQQIKVLLSEGELTQWEIAIRFFVSQSIISQIKRQRI